MALQALHEAQVRVDLLQVQRNEAFSALKANPTSDLEKADYKGLIRPVGLHLLSPTTLHTVEQGNTDFPDQFDTFAVHLATCISQR